MARIRNSSQNNAYGGGKEKRVVENESSSDSLLVDLLLSIMPEWLQLLIGMCAVASPVIFVIYVLIRIFF